MFAERIVTDTCMQHKAVKTDKNEAAIMQFRKKFLLQQWHATTDL